MMNTFVCTVCGMWVCVVCVHTCDMDVCSEFMCVVWVCLCVVCMHLLRVYKQQIIRSVHDSAALLEKSGGSILSEVCLQ